MRMLTPYWVRQSPTLPRSMSWANEWDRFFDEFLPTTMTTDERKLNPFHEISEEENHFMVTVDLPGMKKEDIHVDLQENVLTISGERKKGDTVYASFQRSYTLPANVDSEKVEAQYENGVLNLYLPKVEAVKPRRIEVGAAKEGFFSKLLKTDKKEESGSTTPSTPRAS